MLELALPSAAVIQYLPSRAQSALWPAAGRIGGVAAGRTASHKANPLSRPSIPRTPRDMHAQKRARGSSGTAGAGRLLQEKAIASSSKAQAGTTEM